MTCPLLAQCWRLGRCTEQAAIMTGVPRITADLLGSRVHQCAKRIRCLLLGWKQPQPEISQSRLYRRVGQCLHGRRIEFVNHLLWRAPGGEKPVPAGEGKRRQSDLGKGRNARCQRHARVSSWCDYSPCDRSRSTPANRELSSGEEIYLSREHVGRRRRPEEIAT